MSKFDSHMRLEKKYSPDQPRDENGRFGAGSAISNSLDVAARSEGSYGSKSPTIKMFAKEASDAHAKGDMKKARMAHQQLAAAHSSEAEYGSPGLKEVHLQSAKEHTAIAGALKEKLTAPQVMKTPGFKPKQGPQQMAALIRERSSQQTNARKRGM